MMLLRSEIWASLVSAELTIFTLTLPLNGGMFAVSWARRSTWGRQSLPRKLLLSTNVYGPLCAVAFDDLLAAAPEVRAAVRAVASTAAMQRLTTLFVRKRLRSTS